ETGALVRFRRAGDGTGERRALLPGPRWLREAGLGRARGRRRRVRRLCRRGSYTRVGSWLGADRSTGCRPGTLLRRLGEPRSNGSEGLPVALRAGRDRDRALRQEVSPYAAAERARELRTVERFRYV